MIVDNESKIVWCNSGLFNELTSVKKSLGWVGIVSLFQILWEYQADYPEITKFLWAHENDIWIDEEEPMVETDHENQILMVKIWSEEYSFGLNRPQEYYWRKKREYLAWFEEVDDNYLNQAYGNPFLSSSSEEVADNCKVRFTETEARMLLKGDFHKFEKVEISESKQ